MTNELTTALDALKGTLDDRLDAADGRIDDLVSEVVKMKSGRTDGDGRSARRIEPGGMLAKGESISDHPAVGESREPFRVGALIKAEATGNRRHLNDTEKALAESTGSAGGFLLPFTQIAPVIDRARNATRVVQAGARTIVMESGEGFIPRLSRDPEPEWRGEGSDAAEDAPEWERLTVIPKTLAVATVASRELIEDVSDESYAAIERSLVEAIAVKLDYAALHGLGHSNEPLGLYESGEVTKTPLATDGAAPADYEPWIDAIVDVMGANHEPTAAITSPRTMGDYWKLLDQNNNPLVVPPVVADLQKYVSNNVRNDLTVGVNSDCSAVFIGDFREMALAFRPEATVQVLRSEHALARKLQWLIVAYLRMDVVILRPSAFHVISGVRAS